MPITKTVSIRSLRQNLSKFLKETQEKNVHFVVMKHSVPVARITPASRKDSYEALVRDVAIARQQVKERKTYSIEQVRGMLDV